MEKFKWIYIGSGSIAKKTALNIETGEHEIVAVYSRNKEKAQAFAEKHGAKAYDTAKEAIAHEGADAVYIATPHTSHKEYTLTALKAKMPVLCEKPVGISIGEVDEMLKCAKENDTYFAEAMWTWFSDVALTVKEWVQSDKIGKVKSVSINYGFSTALKPKDSRVINPMTAGGALLDIGIYPITYCYNLFGFPDEIVCKGTIQNGIDTDERITLHYGDMKCKLHIAFKNIGESCVIHGTKGTIKLPLFHMAFAAKMKSKSGNKVYLGKTDYLTEFTKVADEIRAGKKESDYIPFKATRDCMKIMDACRKQMGLVYPFEKG